MRESKIEYVQGSSQLQVSQLESTAENLLYHARMLMTLISDLLDFAKIENQKFTINETYFNLNDLIQRAF